MRKASGLLVAAALSVGFIGTASAADMAVKARPAPLPTVYNWTGWYYGVGFGVSNNESTFDSVGIVPATATAHNWDQVRVSLHGGHQYMVGGMGWGGIVFGLDYSASFPLDNVAGVSACPNPAFGCETRLGSLFTGGGRLGIAFDRFMVYGTGGYALGQVKTRFIPPPGAAASPDAIWQDGFYFGAGVDWMAFKGNGIDLILGFEYKHIDLGTDRHGLFAGAIVPGSTRDVTVTADQFLAKASFKFDGPRWW